MCSVRRPKMEADVQKIRPALQPLQVRGPAKRFSVRHTDGFEQTVTIKKAPVEHGNDRLLFGN